MAHSETDLSKQLKDENKFEENNEVKPIINPALVPKWITEEYFVDILKENVEGFEKIVNFKAFPALAPGENYATLMLRVSIDVLLQNNTNRNVSYMLKVAHEYEQVKEMMKLMNFFNVENGMYFDIIPELEQLYKSAGLEVRFGAQAYKFHKQPPTDIVLLEDLKPYGFVNTNRLEGLNMEHSKQVLKKLAQLHAVSACRVTTKGKYKDIYQQGAFVDIFKKILASMMESYADIWLGNLSKYENGEFYRKTMKNLFDNITEDLTYTYKNVAADDFQVLNHGDCWSNNILFKYDDKGNILEVYFVDFQGPKFGTPAQDLYYFILSSTSLDIKISHFDYLIRFYHENLIENLKILKYVKPMPSLRHIQLQLLKYNPFCTFPVLITLPAVLLDQTEFASAENFLAEDDKGVAFKNQMFSSKRYVEHIGKILPFLYNRGLLQK